jgi:capsule polysaccharide export protein KpsE/RkpR
MKSDAAILRQIERQQLRTAERAVETAKRRLTKAEEATQRAWDKRTEAEEALAEAEHKLKLVHISQRRGEE